MGEKTIKSRIQLKNDTEENWKKAINFIPKRGEMIIYNIDENNSAPRAKIGDGVTNVNDLVFMTNGGAATASSTEFIISTNLESSAALTGITEDKELKNGKQINYFTQFACPGDALTLTLTFADGNSTEALPIYNYSEIQCDIAYPANCIIQLAFITSSLLVLYFSSNLKLITITHFI